MNKLLLLLLLPLGLYPMHKTTKPPLPDNEPASYTSDKSPEEIQLELNQAEADFAYAKTLFSPWYTGPLITPSASMVPPGQMMAQPYVYGVDNYAQFNKERKSISLAHDLVQINTQPVVFQIGITNTVDTTIIFGQLMNWQNGKFGGGIQDLVVQLGFLMYPQSLYVPQFKFSIGQSFPTGKYKDLSTNGLALSGTGAGAYETTFTFTTSKVLFWSTRHPFNTRMTIGYTVTTPVRVHNFNTYGGGFGTKGVVHPGNALTVDVGLELSITQRWVIAMDIVYKATNRTKFNGFPGTLADGTPATVGTGYSDNLSLAPAFEYNFNANAGFIAGPWFSVWGRNSLNFVQGVASYYIVF